MRTLRGTEVGIGSQVQENGGNMIESSNISDNSFIGHVDMAESKFFNSRILSNGDKSVATIIRSTFSDSTVSFSGDEFKRITDSEIKNSSLSDVNLEKATLDGAVSMNSSIENLTAKSNEYGFPSFNDVILSEGHQPLDGMTISGPFQFDGFDGTGLDDYVSKFHKVGLDEINITTPTLIQTDEDFKEFADVIIENKLAENKEAFDARVAPNVEVLSENRTADDFLELESEYSTSFKVRAFDPVDLDPELPNDEYIVLVNNSAFSKDFEFTNESQRNAYQRVYYAKLKGGSIDGDSMMHNVDSEVDVQINHASLDEVIIEKAENDEGKEYGSFSANFSSATRAQFKGDTNLTASKVTDSVFEDVSLRRMDASASFLTNVNVEFDRGNRFDKNPILNGVVSSYLGEKPLDVTIPAEKAGQGISQEEFDGYVAEAKQKQAFNFDGLDNNSKQM